MELIVSHNNTDFDGLASMVAASKLYPDAVMVFTGKPGRQVREFLALHKDALPILDIKGIAMDKVTKVIIVDTRSLKRVGVLAGLLKEKKVAIDIYDHHPPEEGNITGDREMVEDVGATTTLLTETLLAKQVSISPFEATLLALGIYEDTGNLLFENTTARDAKALSFLLQSGANLKLVANFIERPLSREQKSLLNTLLVSARHYLIKGVKVLITSAAWDDFVAGLALLTHRIAEIENLDVIFSVVQMEDRVHIVGRSKGKSLAVNEVLREFGGAGHPKAASATVKDGDIDSIIAKLLSLLENKTVPETTAREIMSVYVRSIAPKSTMAEVGNVLLRYGHTGIPVVEDGKLVGIISRRDVDKALNHGLGHTRVEVYMSRKVITTGPDVSLSEIQELMIVNDIGRLPVVEKGKLVGIISRSDVLRTLHGQAIPVSQPILSQRSRVQGKEILKLIEHLPMEVRDLFRLVQVLGREYGFKVYVVGGFVRDLLLNLSSMDIDLVVEGDGISFASLLAEETGAILQLHHQFGTANLLTKDGLNIDVVTARTEYYDSPASLPRVENSTLRDDLYRRDFTINAMAIELDAEEFGSLKDYYGGYHDLLEGEIRILHNLSFVDDPTRILRAIRFEKRFNFRFEPQSLQMLQNAVKEGLLKQLSRERLKFEFIQMLMEPKVLAMLERLKGLGAWNQVCPGLDYRSLDSLGEIPAACEFLTELGLWQDEELWKVNLLVLLSGIEPERGENILREMKFEKRLVSLAKEFLEREAALKGFLSREGELKRGTLHRVLSGARKECLAALLSLRELNLAVKDYITVWVRSPVALSGQDLKSLGVNPGPKYAELFRALWEARLEGRVSDKEGEIRLVRELLKGEKDVRFKSI